jgi:hypothetical protein
MSNLQGRHLAQSKVIWPFGGTPAYCSPDHELEEEITTKTDIWSWGVCLLEMFAGEVFWRHGKNAARVLSTLVEEEVPPQIPRIPRALQSLLGSCFEECPANRPANMDEIACVLRNIHAAELDKPYERPKPSENNVTLSALNNRGVSLLDLGRPAEAIQTWESVIKRHPEHLESAYNLELYRWRSGRIGDVDFLAALRKMHDQVMGTWQPTYMLSRVLIECGDSVGAVNLLKGHDNPDCGEGLDEAPREVAFALAIAQNGARHDKRVYWECHEGESTVTALCLSNGGSRAFTACEDGRIQVWDVTERRRVLDFEAHAGGVTGPRSTSRAGFSFRAGAMER